jgi:UDP-N-acetyl-D-mannosaminuronate dehydrogenase
VQNTNGPTLKIAIAGMGYVGLSLAVLLGSRHDQIRRLCVVQTLRAEVEALRQQAKTGAGAVSPPAATLEPTS